MLPSRPVTIEEGLSRLKAAAARFQSETPTQPHPFFDRLTSAETVQLHLRHAELHLSFIIPESCG